MSLCYDFEKWLTITLSSVAISLTVGLVLMQYAHGQSESPFANCIVMKIEDSFVQLGMDEDCNQEQFTEAVTYYKANGYPHESEYMDLFGSKFIKLDTKEFADSLE
jgi:hypothetical protein